MIGRQQIVRNGKVHGNAACILQRIGVAVSFLVWKFLYREGCRLEFLPTGVEVREDGSSERPYCFAKQTENGIRTT